MSFRNSSTHRFPRFPPRNLCSLVTLALFFLSSTLRRTQPTVELLFLQDWQNRESFLQRLRTLVPGHLISFCTVQLRTLSAARSLVSVLLRPLVQALGSCPASGAPWSSAMPPSLGRGRVATTTTQDHFHPLNCSFSEPK